MSAPLRVPPLVRRLLVAGLGVVAVQAALIPFAPGSGVVPPDLLYCLMVTWTLRDPRSVPLALVMALGLFADLMLSRPPGLGALGLVLATELARRGAQQSRTTPFLLEWLGAAALYGLILAGMQMALRLTFADAPDLAATGRALATTAAAYPVVAMVVAWGVGLRAPRPERPAARPGRLA